MEGVIFLITMIVVAWLCFWVGTDPSASRRNWAPFDMKPDRPDEEPPPLPPGRFGNHPSHSAARKPESTAATATAPNRPVMTPPRRVRAGS